MSIEGKLGTPDELESIELLLELESIELEELEELIPKELLLELSKLLELLEVPICLPYIRCSQ